MISCCNAGNWQVSSGYYNGCTGCFYVHSSATLGSGCNFFFGCCVCQTPAVKGGVLNACCDYHAWVTAVQNNYVVTATCNGFAGALSATGMVDSLTYDQQPLVRTGIGNSTVVLAGWNSSSTCTPMCVLQFYTNNNCLRASCSYTISPGCCALMAVEYNPGGNVFVALNCNKDLLSSVDGITWNVVCSCACSGMSCFCGDSLFFNTSNCKTVLYTPTSNYGSNATIMFTCNGCSWTHCTICTGCTAPGGAFHEMPGGKLVNYTTSWDTTTFKGVITQPISNAALGSFNYNVARSSSYSSGRCNVYSYALCCYLSIPCSITGTASTDASVYGSADGNGWCWITNIPYSGYPNHVVYNQCTNKIISIDAKHCSYNSNTVIRYANVCSGMTWTTVDTKTKSCNLTRNNNCWCDVTNTVIIRLFTNTNGTRIGWAISDCTYSNGCCSDNYGVWYRNSASVNTTECDILRITSDYGVTSCTVPQCYSHTYGGIGGSLYEPIPSVLSQGNFVTFYHANCCYGCTGASAGYVPGRSAVHYCFDTATNDLVYIGCNSPTCAGGSNGCCYQSYYYTWDGSFCWKRTCSAWPIITQNKKIVYLNAVTAYVNMADCCQSYCWNSAVHATAYDDCSKSLYFIYEECFDRGIPKIGYIKTDVCCIGTPVANTTYLSASATCGNYNYYSCSWKAILGYSSSLSCDDTGFGCSFNNGYKNPMTCPCDNGAFHIASYGITVDCRGVITTKYGPLLTCYNCATYFSVPEYPSTSLQLKNYIKVC